LVLDEALQTCLGETLLELGRLDAVASLLPDVRLFLYSYVRKEAVMSSRIEGTQSSLSDLMLYELDGMPGVPLDDVQEVSCYVQALELGLARIKEGMPLSRRLLCEIHAALMTSGRGVQRQPGEFRQSQVWIGGHRPDQASFVPPPPQHLAACIGQLERFLNDVDGKTSPVMKAALAHVQFETIHPFLDGNGRLGRLLISLILAEAKVLTQPLLYLSLYFKRHRRTYYELLQQVRTHGDWEAWVIFFLGAVQQTAAQAVATAKSLLARHAADKLRCSTLGRQAGSTSKVLEALAARPIASVAALNERTGLTPATTGKCLETLTELGIVRELTGHKRNRLFAYTAVLEILERETFPED
jgi:Fic family protein